MTEAAEVQPTILKIKSQIRWVIRTISIC